MTSSWKRPKFREHRRCSSIGSPSERIALTIGPPSNQLSKNTNHTSYEAGLDKGLKMLAGTLMGPRALAAHAMMVGYSDEMGVVRGVEGSGSSGRSSPSMGKSRSMSQLSSAANTADPVLVADSASNLSSDPLHENIAKLRDDYANLLREVENLRETYKDSLSQFTSSLEKQREYFVAALQDTSLRIRQIDDRVDDKLDQFHYSSDERVKEIEERLDDYKYKMTRFEELQEQRRMEHPLGDSDIASRGREVMSSVISLGLAMVSLLLFVFTTVVDCLKVFSENNALSTCLSLGLFGLIIAMYYYFGLGGRTV